MRCSVLAGVGQVLVWHHNLINTSPVTGWIFHCLEQYNTAWVDMESLYFSYRRFLDQETYLAKVDGGP